MEWTCSNPDWTVTPLSNFCCQVFVRTPGQGTLTATSAGCHSTASIALNATPFDAEEQYDNMVRILPNPANKQVIVTGVDIHQVRIYNLLGELAAALEANGNESVVVDVEGLPKGVYLITVSNKEGRCSTKKLVVH